MRQVNVVVLRVGEQCCWGGWRMMVARCYSNMPLRPRPRTGALPLHSETAPQAYGRFSAYQHRLPGLLADSLPDGWGLLLMDRVFRQQGLRHLGPLDRLAFIGHRAIGACVLSRPKTPMPKRRIRSLALAQESARPGG